MRIFARQSYVYTYVAWVAGLLIGGCGTWLFLTYILSPSQPIPIPFATHEDRHSAQVLLEDSLPAGLSIPSINLDTTFAGLVGVNDDGSVEVPETYTQVGLYKYGPAPGQRGPAVILGHVDSITGPAVFFNLKQISVGDEVLIERADGLTAVFTVTKIEDVSQTQFPTEKVYGDLDYAGLRLITCTGTFSQFTRRYSHNLIIYATLTRLE